MIDFPRLRPVLRLPAALLFLATLSAPGAVAAATRVEGVVEGWYIVRPGDTLRGITALYLGDQELWRDTWTLNPDVANPDLLTPGQRLRVLLRPDNRRPGAQLSWLWRRVEAKPDPIPWNSATREDLLLARDGLRTYEKAAAGLRFDDGTSLRLDESSLVFLRDVQAPAAGATTRRELEVIDGQADIDGSAASSAHEIEVVVRDAHATTRGTVGQPAASRVRKATAASQFMVYGGSGEVAAAAAKVAVPAGMGTSVPPSGPPGTPEPLPPAPTLLAPVASVDRVDFRWKPVNDAGTYTVELCGDEACSQVLARQAALPETSWQAANPPAEARFWRVFAVTASGLDGYASPPSAFALQAGGADTSPPTGTVTLDAAPHTRGEIPCVGTKVALNVELVDDSCGVAEWLPVVDGTVVTREALDAEWADGEHTVTVEAVDRCGNRGRLPPVRFWVDGTAPTFLAETRAPAPLELGMMPESAREVLARRKKWQAKGLSWLEWSSIGNLWLPFPTANTPPAIRKYLAQVRTLRPHTNPSVLAEWDLDPERPWIFFMAPGGNPFATGAGLALGPGNTLWVLARDAGCGLARLTLRSLPPADSAHALGAVEIEATDHFDRQTRLTWDLAEPAAPR